MQQPWGRFSGRAAVPGVAQGAAQGARDDGTDRLARMTHAGARGMVPLQLPGNHGGTERAVSGTVLDAGQAAHAAAPSEYTILGAPLWMRALQAADDTELDEAYAIHGDYATCLGVVQNWNVDAPDRAAVDVAVSGCLTFHLFGKGGTDKLRAPVRAGSFLARVYGSMEARVGAGPGARVPGVP
jgi:hypothetical protein